MKPKALIFYTYLPPWRIDVFNEMGTYYDLTIIFLDAERKGFTYNRQLLLDKLQVKSVFWNKGFKIGSKPFRLGIYNLLKKYNPDIVFTHEYSPTSNLLATFLNLKLLNFKLIITTSDNLNMAESVGGLKKILRRFILETAQGIVVYSTSVQNWYQNNFPWLDVAVCPNIQDPKSLLAYKKDFPLIAEHHKQQFKISKPVILFIGRLEHIKGLDLLIQAFNSSIKTTHQLVIVGEGSQEKILKELVKKLNITENVIFTGHFDSASLYAWYSMAHFFVLPSRFEPFGAVVNESLVLGCPVLASKNIGALDFITENHNGYIFDPENLQEFKDSLFKSIEKFELPKNDRGNLMPCSFEEYVEVFKLIA